MSARYAMQYRPPSFCTLPPKKQWTLVERPRCGYVYERRTDLPLSKYEFGVIEFESPLSPGEIEAYQLMEVRP